MFLNTFILRDQTVLYICKCAYEYRKSWETAAIEANNVHAEIVVPVPDQVFQQQLVLQKSQKEICCWLTIRNHYVGRTFIEPTQNIRSLGVKLKLSARVLKDKLIILIDDF